MMKKNLSLMIILFMLFNAFGQQLVKLKVAPLTELQEAYQPNTTKLTSRFNQEIITRVGGLNDWDGMNNYFNIFGSKLIIHEKDIASNGIINVILRREDGANFYGLYPLLKAEIIPIDETNKKLMNQSSKSTFF